MLGRGRAEGDDPVSAEEKNRRIRPPRRLTRPAHALDSLCAILRLGASPADLAGLREAMQQGLIGWEATAALASQHLLLSAIWPALAEKNLAAPMPLELRGYLSRRAERQGQGKNFLMALEDMYLANAARNAQIRIQALNAIAALNGAGIEPAALKGTRLLLNGDSPFRRGRLLRDIDLVIAAGDWDRAGAALLERGYREVGASPHAASFIAAGATVEIDLHRRPLSLHAPADLPGYLTEEGFWGRTIAIDLPAHQCRQLPPGESLVHSILHTEVADLNFAAGDWALRYLYETAVTTRDPAIRLDWSVVNDLADSHLSLPLRAHLYAANRLFDGALGEGFAGSWRLSRHFGRCRANARHPRSIRRLGILVHKLRQAMAPWYLARKGFLAADAGAARAPVGLWRARGRALADLLGRHGRRLPKLLFGADEDSVPPPRV
jgi:hypothetical protein